MAYQNVRAVILKGNHVLCVKHLHIPESRRVWNLPGGTIEKDETPFMALIREVKEETGLSVLSGKATFQDNHRCFYLCAVNGTPATEPQKTPGTDILEVSAPVWVSIEGLLRLDIDMVESHRAGLLRSLRHVESNEIKKILAECGWNA